MSRNGNPGIFPLFVWMAGPRERDVKGDGLKILAICGISRFYFLIFFFYFDKLQLNKFLGREAPRC